jgi:hypothetical protein
MTTEECGWNKAAHGKGIHEPGVEHLIGRNAGCGNLPRSAVAISLGFDERQQLGIDAKSVFASVFDQGLGVNGTVQVQVEVAALGHRAQKALEEKRVLAGSVKSSSCCMIRRRGSGTGPGLQGYGERQ